ncbi:MAG TPA: YraN family protein [Terriglobales bacterium]|nr:YraN family protein [Terriglobales bacterium]
MFASITKLALGLLDRLAQTANSNPDEQPSEHLVIGQRGEEAAYFHLRSLGYVIVARNFRSPRHKGEIDLIGWDRDQLCFIEVKTRTSRELMPAEAAVDLPKQAMLRATARAYLRKIKELPPLRFDVVSVYYESQDPQPDIILFKNAFPVS